DGGGPASVLAASQSFVLTVTAANVPPHLTPIGDKVAVVGQPFQLVLSARDGDQDALTFSALGLPATASLTPSAGYGQAVLTWTPTFPQVGTYSGIVLRASDGSMTATQTISITVSPVNLPPSFVPLLPQSGREDARLQFTVAADDPNTDTLTYSVVAGLPI